MPLARLKQRKDFLRLTRRGRKCVTLRLVLQALPRIAAEGRSDLSAPRVGFTASRKVGGAVARNRARRRLRAVADEVLADRAAPDTDFVLIARPATVTAPYAELKADLMKALAKVGALRTRAGDGG